MRNRFLFAFLLLPGWFLVSPGGAGARYVTRCPRGTMPVRTADARTPWACIHKGVRYRDGIGCPKGYQPVTTTNQYDPFKCAIVGVELRSPRGVCPPGHKVIPTSNPKRDYDCEKVRKGFRGGPRCPRGTRPMPTPGALKPFRCVRRSKASEIEPYAVPDFGSRRTKKKPKAVKPGKKGCPKGTTLVRTENPFDPVQCVSKKLTKLKKASYTRFRIKGRLTFQYPKAWNLTNAWDDDEIPTIYLASSSGGAQRPISLTVSLQRRGTPSYTEMKTMIRREKEWHGAQVVGEGTLRGLPATYLLTEGETKTAFLEVPDGYYMITYNAPLRLFQQYVPAYEKLLKSFRHYSKGRSRK